MKVYQHIVKVKEESTVKPGNIIMAQSFWDDEDLQRSVILILQHDERGSAGLILNRQSNLKVSDVIPDLNLNHDLYYGGPRGINKIGFLHSLNLSQAVHISDDLFWGGNIYQLQHLLNHDEIDGDSVRFFAGLIEWQPGELNREIELKKWWVDDFRFNDLIHNDSNSLWSSKLIKSGNLYALLHEVPDPVLN